MAHERFISLATVQRELCLSTDELFLLIKSGELPTIHLLDSWLVDRAVLEQFIGRLYASTAVQLADRDRMDLDEEKNSDATLPRSRKDAETADSVALALSSLTPQMRRVLDLVARGMSNTEIAAELTLEVSTVKSHVSNLLSRLSVPNREHLIALSWRSGIVRLED